MNQSDLEFGSFSVDANLLGIIARVKRGPHIFTLSTMMGIILKQVYRLLCIYFSRVSLPISGLVYTILFGLLYATFWHHSKIISGLLYAIFSGHIKVSSQWVLYDLFHASRLFLSSTLYVA
jgi:hypothetical protein